MHIYITPEDYEEAEKNGISKKLLEQRVRDRGWKKERAVNEKPNVITDEKKKWYVVAQKNGICKTTFSNRVNNLGWSYMKAATEKVDIRRKKLCKGDSK